LTNNSTMLSKVTHALHDWHFGYVNWHLGNVSTILGI